MTANPMRPLDLYTDRKLSHGYPELDRLAFEHFHKTQTAKHYNMPRVERMLDLMGRLNTLDGHKPVCVIGCGPVPQTIRILRALGYAVSVVEPVPSFVQK